MPIEYILGHAAGIAAVMIYVIVKSILWYRIPPIVRRDGDRLYNVRSEYPAARRVSRIALVVSAVLLAVSTILTNINVFGAYLLVLLGVAMLIVFQESGRLTDSIREEGYDDLEAALDELLSNESRSDAPEHDQNAPVASQDYRDQTSTPSDGSEYHHGGQLHHHDGAEYQQDTPDDDSVSRQHTK